MDVHAGKAVIDGPLNYLGSFYRATPIGITVEGANILTRSLIMFGQGAIRSHPSPPRRDAGACHRRTPSGARRLRQGILGPCRSHAETRSAPGGGPGREDGSPRRREPAPPAHYRRLSRYAAAFALTADMALLTLGGALKRKEMLSGRLGDILSELFLLSAVLKRWNDEGRQEADLPVVDWCMETGYATIEKRLGEVFANLPNRFAAGLLRFLVHAARHYAVADRPTR
jgi:acyl-CoA dehydrogenase